MSAQSGVKSGQERSSRHHLTSIFQFQLSHSVTQTVTAISLTAVTSGKQDQVIELMVSGVWLWCPFTLANFSGDTMDYGYLIVINVKKFRL